MICVVVPTYNEASNIAELLGRLLALPVGCDVLVVDDLSPDGTALIARKAGSQHPGRVHVLDRDGVKGYGAASKEGLRWALERGYELICTIDGDLTHDTAVLPQVVALAQAGADLVIGSRYAPGGGVAHDFPLHRRALSRAGNAYARLVMGAPARDNTSGYRCYRASTLERIDLGSIQSDGYFFLIELIAALHAAGASIAEVPITYAVRASGSSNISVPIVLEALGRTTVLGIRTRLARARPEPPGRTDP